MRHGQGLASAGRPVAVQEHAPGMISDADSGAGGDGVFAAAAQNVLLMHPVFELVSRHEDALAGPVLQIGVKDGYKRAPSSRPAIVDHYKGPEFVH